MLLYFYNKNKLSFYNLINGENCNTFILFLTKMFFSPIWLFYLFFIYVLTPPTSEQSISYSFFTYMGLPYIENTFREVTPSVFLPIHTYQNATFLSKVIYKIDDPDNLTETMEVKVNNKSFHSSIVTKSVYYNTKLNNEIIKTFPFLHVDSFMFDFFSSGYGATCKFNDESFSFIHQLYNNKKIDSKQFTIIPREEENLTIGSIHFGSPPQKTDNTYYQFNGKCKVNNKFPYWGCHLISIKIGELFLPINKYSVFNTCDMYMIKSKEFFKFIEMKLLNKNILNHTCFVNENEEGLFFLKCITRNILLDKDIIFEFEGFIFKLELKLLFRCLGDTCTSRFGYKIEEDGGDDSIVFFGYPFMSLFNGINFNYDKEEISFYSTDLIFQNVKEKNKYLFSIFLLADLLTSIGIINLILVKFCI